MPVHESVHKIHLYVYCIVNVGFVRYPQTTSGGVLSGCERYASGWRCSVNARVDVSGTAATRLLIANHARKNHDNVG